jgi:hypothetical protein
VDPAHLADTARVSGTWLSGKRIDLDAFVGAVRGADAAPHAALSNSARRACC